MSNNRKVKGYLMYNYKQDKLRVRQTKPSKSDVSPYEIPLRLNLEVNVPDFDIKEISKTIDIPETKVREAVSSLEAVEYESETDLPDPKRVLVDNNAEGLEDFFDEFVADVEIRDTDELQEIVDWVRDILAEEYSQRRRDDVIEVLEDELTELKAWLEEEMQ